MGSKFSKRKTPKEPQILEINVQPGPSQVRSDGEINHPPPLYHEISSSSSESSFSSNGRKLSIVSIISTDSENQEDTTEIRERKNNGKIAEFLCESSEPLELTDLSKLDPEKEKERIEAESERLFREEQERQKKEKQQQRAKTARLKRRSELYGGSNADISQGKNGVKSAESVLRLIGSGSNNVELVPTVSQNVQKYIASLPAAPVCKKESNEGLTFQRSSPKIHPGTPMPILHKGISKLIESETETISRSDKYVRKLTNRNASSNSTKKLSPLVSRRELHEKVVLNSPTNGMVGQSSAWRSVPMNSVRKSDPSVVPSQVPSIASRRGVLPSCPSSKTKAGILLEGNLTMNKIEKFLETREHIDKTEFDMVVRNLVEQQKTPPKSHYRQITSSMVKKNTTFNRQLQQQQPKTSLPEFPTHLAKSVNNNNENVFLAAPYHPEQTKYYGKNKFFEPAAYVHLPNVSSKLDTVKTQDDNNLELPDGSKASMKSERSEKGQKERSSTGLFGNESINVNSVISSFNGTRSAFPTQPIEKQSADVPLGSVKGLPPVSTAPLVTRTCTGSNRDTRFKNFNRSSETFPELCYQDTCRHNAMKNDCSRCRRPPSRGGRALMEWLHSKRRSSI